MVNSIPQEVRVACTSSLIHSPYIWKEISSNFTIKVGSHNNLFFALENTEDVFASMAIVIAEDIIETTSSQADLSELLQALLRNFEARIKSSRTPLIIALLKYQRRTIIEVAQRRPVAHTLLVEFENSIFDLAQKFPNLFFLNLDQSLANMGMIQALDDRNWYFARCRFSAKALRKIAADLEEILMRIKIARSKLLVLDCDNTLWGGVAGDEDISELLIGQDGIGHIYKDFQKVVLHWKENGILIALVSKNDEETVWRVFDFHDEMILRRKDLVATRINWLDKPSNVKSLQEELSIGLDSIVFWDDNPLERDLMRLSLPEVHTVEVPTELERWPALLRTMFEFADFRVLESDSTKTREYALRKKFQQDASIALDKEAYLLSIKMIPRVHQINEGNLARAFQLVSKTNQFNLRTQRMSISEINEIVQDNPFSFITSLEDSYGDHGLVGLVIARPQNTSDIFIENFVMSCRVFGRNLESWMLEQLIRKASYAGFSRVIGEFKPSGKNEIVRDFFAQHQFYVTPLENEDVGVVRYEMVLEEVKLPFTKVFIMDSTKSS